MGLPKKIKKHIPLEFGVSPLERRHQLADMIAEKGTFLPKGLLHADLDKGFLEFVKDNLSISIEGKKISIVDILITTQNWSQFTETWNFQNLDKNAEPPFVTVVRQPEVKFGDPQIKYNIPNRRLYHYAQVPTWDGQRHGMDIYKIPQPIPIQINYTVVIICNRMREINEFNSNLLLSLPLSLSFSFLTTFRYTALGSSESFEYFIPFTVKVPSLLQSKTACSINADLICSESIAPFSKANRS